MPTPPALRRALAELGYHLLVIRPGAPVTVEGLGSVNGAQPLAVVWDDDPAIVRARLRKAIRCLPEPLKKAR